MPEIRSFGSFGSLGVRSFSQWDVVFSEDNDYQTKPGNFHLFFWIAAKYKSLRFLSNFSSISVVILIILLNINVFFYAWNGEAIFFL